MFKKSFYTVIAFLLLTSVAGAQDEFVPGWQFGVKGGAGITVGESAKPFRDLLSPSASIDFGYRFSPLFALRADVAGLQGKGVCTAKNGDMYGWKYNYTTLAVDAVFDVCSMFAPYKMRVVNPYLFAGAGGLCRFNNGADASILPYENNYWTGTKLSYVLRVGAGIDFRITKLFGIGIEFVENMTDDNFNSKKGDFFDHQMNLLVGLNFAFGQNSSKATSSSAAVAKAEAEDAVAALAAAVPVEAKPSAASQESPAAETECKPCPAEAPAAVANVAASIEPVSVYFLIGKSDILPEQQKTIDALVKRLAEMPLVKVTVCGHADKQTGNHAINLTLSRKRAEIVTAALVNAGISGDRISTIWKGDSEPVSDIPEKNRVAVIVSE